MLSRIYHDVKNSLSDAYGHFMLGDDAGKGATFACIFRPRRINMDSNNNAMVSNKFDLGVTFCEVNERAYVRTVDPDSDAAIAGVRPRDCVQLALVLAGGKLEALQEDDRRAISHALECESGGSRTSYDEMRVLFERCTVPPRSSNACGPDDKLSDSIFENSSTSTDDGRRSTSFFSTNVTKSTQRIISRYNPTQSYEERDGGWMPSSLDDEALYPVVLVFRRTRKRVPGFSPINVPTFRLDDECERAANLIRRLAPTVDTEFQPDAWDEIMESAKEYFNAASNNTSGNAPYINPKDSRSLPKRPGSSSLSTAAHEVLEEELIPLDPMEEKTLELMESLKNKMKADLDHQQKDGEYNVEAETVRGMIQQALGLAFIRTSKVVLGVSVHAGTGIVIARLPDGTWSAPSAIGAYGLGLGIQFGLETVDYIFIIQKQEALEHFLRGGNFTLGGNVGAALAGLGREAYGAASLRDTICLSPADRLEIENPIVQNATEIAPIVAYAKAQGLYMGMSVEGQKFYSRDDVNDRIYKFMAGRSVTAREILTGVISTPPEAEDLYAALHSVEFTHEIMRLPRPPRILRDDIKNEWRCDRPTLTLKKNTEHGGSLHQFAFFDHLGPDESQEFSIFETKFKSFLYCGVSVQRIIPGLTKAKRERRTLWLMLPEVGSLQLGLVAKSSDDPNESFTIAQRAVDDQSEVSYSLKSNQGSDEIMKFDGDDTTIGESDNLTVGGTRRRLTKVRLSSDHSMALTDITVMKLNPSGSSIPKLDDDSEHSRLIYIEEISRNKSLMLLANTVIEAEILLCGLKLLIERETARFGMRGGQPMSAFGVLSTQKTTSNTINDERQHNKVQATRPALTEKNIPSAPRIPMIKSDTTNNDNRYEYGLSIVSPLEDVTVLAMPLPLCRALILDSSSPVIKKWDQDRGDTDYVKSSWGFSTSTSRHSENHSSELKYISSSTMVGASRTVTFKRARNGQKVSLSETHIVDTDTSSELSISIQEKMPRRGFDVQVKIKLSAVTNQSCQALIIADLTPIGRNMTDQSAVHKAYLLVIDELKARYGSGTKGLIHGLQLVTHPSHTPRPNSNIDSLSRSSSAELKPATREITTLEIATKKQLTFHAPVSDKGQQSLDPQDHRDYSSGVLRLSNSANQRAAATIVVPQLPRIPLALMPCPREEDESKVDDESLHEYKARNSRR